MILSKRSINLFLSGSECVFVESTCDLIHNYCIPLVFCFFFPFPPFKYITSFTSLPKMAALGCVLDGGGWSRDRNPPLDICLWTRMKQVFFPFPAKKIMLRDPDPAAWMWQAWVTKYLFFSAFTVVKKIIHAILRDEEGWWKRWGS